MFTGGAGSGESEIRRYILENDLLEGIVALPTDMFYNTGIATYVWVLSNRKRPERRGKVQLVNATEMFGKMRRSLGSKRNTIEEHADAIVKLYGAFEENERSKIFPTTEFGYRRITVERPLRLTYLPHDEAKLEALQDDKGWSKLKAEERDALLAALGDAAGAHPEPEVLPPATPASAQDDDVKLTASLKKLLQKHCRRATSSAEVCLSKGKPEADPSLRDYENVPLSDDVDDYFAREVQPHVPDAWIDREQDGPARQLGWNRRIRDPVQPALLPVPSPATARGNRSRAGRDHQRDCGDVAGNSFADGQGVGRLLRAISLKVGRFASSGTSAGCNRGRSPREESRRWSGLTFAVYGSNGTVCVRIRTC